MSKPPSWNEIRSNAQQFATRWHGTADENAEAQTFWNEFLGIFGIDRKRVATFEARAKRQSTGGRGRIDLLWPGTLVAEHKSEGKDLANAEEQALDYLESIDVRDFPGVVITSDFAHFRVRDLGGDNEPYTFPLEKLPAEIDRFGFIAGYKQRKFGDREEEEANVKAAKLMGALYEELARTGYEGHDASVLMTRLLFLMFGDDTGMWERGLFSEFIESRTQPDGSDLGAQLAFLFQTLDKAEDKRSATTDELLMRFPYVNGHLFSDRIDIPSFDKRMRDELVKCTEFDWSKISPAVFGSLFQAVKSKEARRTLGEHYTTEHNILRALAPLFLDDLWEEFQKIRDNSNRLEKFHDKLANIKVLDPACGCGNFLVIAYRELRRLELATLVRLEELSGAGQLHLDVSNMVRVKLSNFYGIEIEEWPARIAETAMFLVDQQANHELARQFGQAPDRLPIMQAANITIGNALSLDWEDVVPSSECSYVVGNPPFVGTRMQTPEQKALQLVVWEGASKAASMDFVTNWFVKAARYTAGKTASVAFVATNSVTQGEQPALLWSELRKYNVEIAFAHRSFAWSSEATGAASVHVVIIGFHSGSRSGARRLFDYPDMRGEPIERTAKHINPYLIDGPDVLVAARTAPFSSKMLPMQAGNEPRDAGILSSIDDAEAAAIRTTDPVAGQYLRRIYGSQEHIRGEVRWCLWLVDAPPSDIHQSPELRSRVKRVLEERQGKKGNKGRAADRPARFSYVCQPNTGYLLVPSVSSENRRYIPMAFYSKDDIVTNAVFFIPGADVELFGLLSSSMFTEWVALVSSRLKSDYQISVTAVYNTFPVPDTTDQSKRDRVTLAATEVLTVRDSFPGTPLSVLYDPLSMPPELFKAHAKLDAAVDALFGAGKIETSSERQELLLDRYAELVAADKLFSDKPEKKPRKKKAD